MKNVLKGRINILTYIRELTGCDLKNACVIVDVFLKEMEVMEDERVRDIPALTLEQVMNLSLVCGKIVRGDWKVQGGTIIRNINPNVNREDILDLMARYPISEVKYD